MGGFDLGVRPAAGDFVPGLEVGRSQQFPLTSVCDTRKIERT